MPALAPRDLAHQFLLQSDNGIRLYPFFQTISQRNNVQVFSACHRGYFNDWALLVFWSHPAYTFLFCHFIASLLFLYISFPFASKTSRRLPHSQVWFSGFSNAHPKYVSPHLGHSILNKFLSALDRASLSVGTGIVFKLHVFYLSIFKLSANEY